MNPSPPPTSRIDELDGLRGLLALWVAVTHMICWCGLVELTLPWPFSRFWFDFIFAEPAVETFIILSGFAISFMLHQRPTTWSRFMLGRFFRIYPVYIVCLLIGIAMATLTPIIVRSAPWHDTFYFIAIEQTSVQEETHPAPHIGAHLTLLHGMIPKSVLPESTATFLAPAWSISLEWQFYLVAPLLMWLIRSGIGLLAIGVLMWTGSRFGTPWLNPHTAFLPVQLPLFMVGIASYHIYAKWRDPLSSDSMRYDLFAPALLVIAAVSSWHTIALAIWAIGFGCIFANGNDPFSRMLCGVKWILMRPSLQWLGHISYPLYLLHYPFIIGFLYLLIQFVPSITRVRAFGVIFVVGLPILLMLTYLMHRSIEVPAMRFGKVVNPR